MLSALAIDNARPRKEPCVMTDGQGLHLLVTANGGKLRRRRYRFRGKQNMLSLGSFPQVPPSLARARAFTAR